MNVKLLVTIAFLLSNLVYANLCESVRDKDADVEAETEISFYEQIFGEDKYHGSRTYNEMLVECNRKRDNKGDEVRKILTHSDFNEMKSILQEQNLPLYLVNAKFKFFGFAWFKYSYLLKKKNGIWTMILPYDPVINDIVKDRVDFNMTHARSLYEQGQVRSITFNGNTSYQLRPGANPISTTLCSNSTFFSGKEHKYDNQNGTNAHKRDRENKFISLGKIEYAYKGSNGTYQPKQGCRVNKNIDLFYNDGTSLKKINPEKWLLDNFVKVTEKYWSTPGEYNLKILLKGHNESRFSTDVLDRLKNNDYLKIRFGTTFLPFNNQMYKANLWQPNNFSTMTSDGTFIHEVGHALGLDDEYGKDNSKGNCGNTHYDDLDSATGALYPYTINNYTMCHGYGTQVNSVYQYIAVSRYLLGEICKVDTDCGQGRYCNIRIGGVNRCLEDGTKIIGQSCNMNKECRSNKCQGTGNERMCVCGQNSDCTQGQICKKPIGKKNYCQ